MTVNPLNSDTPNVPDLLELRDPERPWLMLKLAYSTFCTPRTSSSSPTHLSARPPSVHAIRMGRHHARSLPTPR